MEISMRVWNFLIVIMATPNNLLNLANVAVRFFQQSGTGCKMITAEL